MGSRRMSGEWIKMRMDLFSHPKVVRMASALKADNLRTVGGLMSAWCLFDVHSIDGSLSGYSPQSLDDHLRWSGFSAAMIAVDWLIVGENDSLQLPRFEAHNGQSAKRRAQDADRKKEVRKTSAPEADKKRTREEKRREEKKEQKQKKDAPPVGDFFPGVDPKIVSDFLAIRKAKRLPLTDTAVAGIAQEAAKAGLTMQAALTKCCVRGWAGFEAHWLEDEPRGKSGHLRAVSGDYKPIPGEL
jgi:hypothetical protein